MMRKALPAHLVALAAAAAVAAALFACGGTGATGGAAAGRLDYPADTTALIGFARKGPAPTADELRGALSALIAVAPDRVEADGMFARCIVPITTSLDRMTIAVVGKIDDGRVLVRAAGKGLRGALEGCLGSMGQEHGQRLTPSQDGALTIYAVGGDELVAAWESGDRGLFGSKRELVTDGLAAKDGLRGTALEKALAGVDPAADLWVAAAGPALADEVDVSAATGSVVGLAGSLRLTFASPEAAERAATMARGTFSATIDVKGAELTATLDVRELTSMIQGRPGDPPAAPKLTEAQARTLVAAGPMVLGWLVFAAGEEARPSAVAAPPATPDAPTTNQ